MGGLVKTPKPPKPIETPPPPTVPVETGEQAIKEATRRPGYAKTLLTGSLTPKTKRKSLLG